jgi:hypothetical protein
MDRSSVSRRPHYKMLSRLSHDEGTIVRAEFRKWWRFDTELDDRVVE